MKDPTYYPVWIDSDGTEWVEESISETCEFGDVPFDPDNFTPLTAGEPLLPESSENDCPNRIEFVGQRASTRIQLCGTHFMRMIEPRCVVRWNELRA